jgi:phenylacetate-CoA ligase
VVERIEGRLQEFVVCRDERLISICALGAAHFDALAAVESMQFEQREPGRLILNIISGQPLAETARLAVCLAVEARTQQGCEVTVQVVRSIPRTSLGKHRMLVQHLDVQRYFAGAGSQAGSAPALMSKTFVGDPGLSE